MRQITISGNLGSDPVLRQTNNGTQVANFDLAVRQDRVNQQTNQYDTDWFRVTVFGNRANTVMQYFHRGSHVTVSGSFSASMYFSQKTGQNQVQLEVNAIAFDLPDNNRQMAQQQQDVNQAANRFNQSQQNNGYAQQPAQNSGYQQNYQQPNGYQPQANQQGYQQQAKQQAPVQPAQQVPQQPQSKADPFAANGDAVNISDDDLPF